MTSVLSSLTCDLHFCFVPDGTGRAHAPYPIAGGGGFSVSGCI